MIGHSNKVTNLPYKLLLNDRQVLRLCEAFANNSSGATKLSKTQLFKMVQFLGWYRKNHSWKNRSSEIEQTHSKLFLDTGYNIFNKKFHLLWVQE